MSDSAALVSIFSQLSRQLKGLGQEDVEKIASGETEIKLVPKGSKVVVPLQLSVVAADVRRHGSADEIVQLLDSDKRLTVGELKSLAGELNIELPKTATRKGPIQLHIAQSAAAHWQRTHGGL